MKIELSQCGDPLETSIPALVKKSTKKKRTTPGAGTPRSNSRDSKESSIHPHSLSLLEVFFPAHVRYSSKMRKIADETLDPNHRVLQPQIVLTTPHRISVIGSRKRNDDEDNEPGDDDKINTGKAQVIRDNRHQLYEYDMYQYSTKPSETFAFLDSDNNQHRIPAMADFRLSKMYAVQNHNTTLVCWGMNEDSEKAIRFSLPDASLRFLDLSLYTIGSSSSFLYGTLSNFQLFIAEFNDLSNEWKISYFDTTLNEEDRKAGDVHFLRTLVHVEESISNETTNSKKRKQPDSTHAEQGPLVCCQIFRKDGQCTVLKRSLSQDSFQEQKSPSGYQWTPFVPFGQTDSVYRASVIGVCDSQTSFVLSFTTKGEHLKSLKNFATTISLQNGRTVFGPVQVGHSTQSETHLFGEDFLAIKLYNRVEILDRRRGCLVAQFDAIPSLPFHLATDPRKRALVIVCRGESDFLRVTKVEMNLDKKRLPSLADVLTASLNCPAESSTCVTSRCDVLIEDGRAAIHEENQRMALDVLRRINSLRKALAASSLSSNDLLDLCESILSVAQTVHMTPKSDKVVNGKSHEALKNGQKNGISKPLQNGTESNHLREGSVRSTLVNALGRTCVQALCQIRLLQDPQAADIILPVMKALVSTGSLNPVEVFDEKSGLKATFSCLHLSHLHGNAAYTSVHFAFDVLRFCTGLNEWQVVEILRQVVFKTPVVELREFLIHSDFDYESNSRREFRCRSGMDVQNGHTPETDSKVLKSVIFLFLGTIWSSDCNPSLLRDALRATFPIDELVIMFRLFFRKSIFESLSSTKEIKQAAFTWLTACCDVLKREDSSSEIVMKILTNFKLGIKQSERIVALHGDLQRAVEATEKQEITSDATATRRKRVGKSQLLPYQLERLVF